MEKKNLKKGLYYCDIYNVYKFDSNGFLGKNVKSLFWICEYDNILNRYEPMSKFVFMDEDQVKTLDYL